MTVNRTVRRRRDADGGLWIDGEFFMGRVRVPPMPNRLALTDRLTGEVLVLSNDDALDVAVLDDIDPRQMDVQIYGPFEGPYFGQWRIYLYDGDIFAEHVDEKHNNAHILTRWLYHTRVLRITVDATGTVVYTPFDL